MAMQMSADGRAKLIKRAGKFSVAIDEAGKPVTAWIGPRNSSGFSKRQIFVRPPDAFRIKFKDRTNNYEDAERLVPRPGLVGEPVEIEELSLPGITDPVMIYREGVRRHLEIQYRRVEYGATQAYEALTEPEQSWQWGDAPRRPRAETGVVGHCIGAALALALVAFALALAGA
jgi:hypothetical protein